MAPGPLAPTLDEIAPRIRRYRASLADAGIQVCMSRIDTLCTGALAPREPAGAPPVAGGWPEFVTSFLFSAVNYRFVHLRTLERPRLSVGGASLEGSQAFEHDLRRIVAEHGFDRQGLQRLGCELAPGHWSPSVARGICDLEWRCLRLRFLAEAITAQWVPLTEIHSRGDIDAALRLAWFTGLYIDPFLKRLQYLIHAWMRTVSGMQRHLPRARLLTALCDYRLPELLLDQGVISWPDAAGHEGGQTVLRLHGADARVAALRAASAQVVEEVARRTGLTQIDVDQRLWQASRARARPIRLVVDTDAF